MKYYRRIDKSGKTLTVESYNHNNPVNDAVEITVEEYNAFIASLPGPESTPGVKTIETEVQELKVQVQTLEQRIALLEHAK